MSERDPRLDMYAAGELGAAAARRGDAEDRNPCRPGGRPWMGWRTGHRLATERGDQMHRPALFWLSFADPARPKGAQFLGVVIIEALSYVEAIATATRSGINPGGEILGSELDQEVRCLIASEQRDRLLPEPEVIALNGLIGRRH